MILALDLPVRAANRLALNRAVTPPALGKVQHLPVIFAEHFSSITRFLIDKDPLPIRDPLRTLDAFLL